MKMLRRTFLVAAAAAMILTGGSATRAAFDYSVAVTSPSGGSVTTPNYTVTLAPVNQTNLATIEQTLALVRLSVDVPGTATGTSAVDIPYALTVTITNPSGTGPTGTAMITGTLTGTAGSLGGSPFSNIQNTFTGASVLPPPLSTTPPVIGDLQFQFTQLLYAAATVNFPNSGAISARLVPIPEPSSVVLTSLGAVGLLGLYLRRRLQVAI